jgi:hypothetical protein
LPGRYATITLTRTRTVVEQRLRALPSRVGVYYLLALALFPDHSYQGVWSKLTASLRQLGLSEVSQTALRHLRRRVTASPLKLLFETLAGPLAPPHSPGVSYRRWRTVAFDGCSSIKTPDSERARGWLGKVRHRLAWAGYPTVQLMTLVETGTRGIPHRPRPQYRNPRTGHPRNERTRQAQQPLTEDDLPEQLIREEPSPQDPGGHVPLALAVLRSSPGKPWHARDVARELNVTNINSFRVQMSQWEHRG